jgi:hypothetical protein
VRCTGVPSQLFLYGVTIPDAEVNSLI